MPLPDFPGTSRPLIQKPHILAQDVGLLFAFCEGEVAEGGVLETQSR